MKKILFATFFILFLYQFSYAQDQVKIRMKDATNEYNNGNYQAALDIVSEIKPLFKSVPPILNYLEIVSKSKIIQSNPLADYYAIEDTRKLINNYLSNPINKKSSLHYNDILQEKRLFNNYPKDKAEFDAQLEEIEKEKARIEAAKEKARVEAAKEKARIEAAKEKARIEAERLESIKLAKIEEEKIRKQNEAFEAEQRRIAEAERQSELKRIAEENAIQENIRREKAAKAERRRLKEFSSLGFQGGEIAKYGILYETGGETFIGFHMSIRGSSTKDEDILNGLVKKNKTEMDLGPSIKISKRIYLNLGFGYGFYNYVLNNDYNGTFKLEKKGYTEASAGLMIRINRIININGGASFMDVDKEIYKPEITFGISFNLKGR